MGDLIHPKPAEFTAAQIQDDPILRYFHYAHLPVGLQAISKPFCDLAGHIVFTSPRSAERSVALRKLLEAKDAAVRAAVPAVTAKIQRDDGGFAGVGEVKTTGVNKSEEPIPFE